MVKVSVITVVYNNVWKIEKTIQNVLKQTYNNIEYIVVDGASTDGTLDIIKKYENRILWISEPDKGIYDAMMKGARMAKGEWIIFRNCGDFFYSPSSVDDIFSQYHDNNEDFILANSRLFLDWGYFDCRPSIINCSYQDRMPVLHPSTFIRRETQLKYPFHLEYRNSADYCFFVEAFNNGATYCHYDIIVALVESGIGTTAESYDRTLKENIDFLSKMGANSSRIKELKRAYWKLILENKCKLFLPYFKWYEKKKKIKNGWILDDINHILVNV